MHNSCTNCIFVNRNIKINKMKKLITIALTLSLFGTYAQKVSFDTEKSTIAWIGKKIGGQHEGYIKLKKGFLEIKNNKIINGNFVIDMNSITCTDLEDDRYNEKLVGHLKSDDFFGTTKYPEATLIINEASQFQNGKSKITGKITIKDKTEFIQFTIEKNKNDFIAEINIDRSKFNVKYGSKSFFDNLGDNVIDDIFSLKIKLKTK